MPRNVEIKARVASVEALAVLEARAAALAGTGPQDLHQDDTFFRCAEGRLKLRVEGVAGAASEARLIFYRRPDQAGPKLSFYVMTATADPDGLREALSLACGSLGRVVKQRRLYGIGRTRVHLDRVQGLGPFVELEVVLADGEAVEAGEREAATLMEHLGIAEGDRVEAAYLDLLGDGPGAAVAPAGNGPDR